MTFILQGNPKKFDIDDYLGRYTQIYWRAPVLRNAMQIGDKVVIWRAGPEAGAIAVGRIIERPTEKENIKNPDALGDDLWRAEVDNPSVVKVGIAIDDVRLTVESGMITRNALMNDSVLMNNRIITNPQGTVFRLSAEEDSQFFKLWGNPYVVSTNFDDQTAIEGRLQLHQHYSRERSRYLIKKKREEYISNHGQLRCEICSLSEGDNYPIDFGAPFIEVHHIVPLSSVSGQVRTGLKDLLLLCANCHRTIHSSHDVETNLKRLREHYKV
jgi:hypothetical protein